jgi:hypothetical protein
MVLSSVLLHWHKNLDGEDIAHELRAEHISQREYILIVDCWTFEENGAVLENAKSFLMNLSVDKKDGRRNHLAMAIFKSFHKMHHLCRSFF